MRLICPNCVAQYEVDEDVIPSEGRDVQCANCGHNWFQDALQMLSSEAEIPTGTGDPESDVPQELFNDLEGKLDTSFTSIRAEVAPDPNDMEPQIPRDDFQIEQVATAPSSRLDRDALDVLHAEAEYSSGQKPPAASEQKSQSPETATETSPEISPDTQPEETAVETQEATQDSQQPTEPVDDTTLDEIRRRIMNLEAQENGTDQSAPAPQQKPAPRADNPFSRPSVSATRNSTAPPPAADPVAPAEPRYTENIPVEEDIAATLHQERSIDDAIEDITAEHLEAEVTSGRSAQQAAPRPFPALDADDALYDAIDDAGETRSSMFPDVDELSSEIASEADYNIVDHQPTTLGIKAKGGFFKGFKYAIYLCVVIGALYQFQAVIIEYIPQAEGVLTKLTELVDNTASQIVPLINPLLEKIKGLIG